MLTSFLFNFCLMITVISLLQYFLKDSKLDLTWNLSRRLAVGLLMGGVGMILIKNSVHFTDTIVIDLRYVVFMVAAYFGGPVVSVTAGVLILTYRLLFLGVTLNSQVATLSGTLTLLSFNWVSRMKWPFRKTMLGYAGSMIFWIVIGSTILRIWTPNYVAYVIAMISTSLVVGALIINFITYTFEGLKHHRRLAFSHDYDYLTKLHSVRYFDVELNHQFEDAKQNQWPMSLLMLDLDHFKNVNDTYGHDVGDIVLKELGILLMTQCRPTDIVARKGGEEFAIILNHCDLVQAKVIAERIRGAVEQMRFAVDKQPLNMTISLGIATFPQHAQNANELLKRADIALYQAKANGRNRVEEAALINVKPSFDELAVPPSGNADIDQEHQFALDLLDTITKAIRDGALAQQILPSFKRLKDHFFLHCINEERILGEHGYPAALLKKHHQKHQELIHLFEFLEQRLTYSNGTLDEEYIQILTRIIVGHMYSDDQSFFEHLKQSIV